MLQLLHQKHKLIFAILTLIPFREIIEKHENSLLTTVGLQFTSISYYKQ